MAGVYLMNVFVASKINLIPSTESAPCVDRRAFWHGYKS
jgi:hypothetical protein